MSVDPNYFRPSEVDVLVGDSSKAKKKLGWIPKYDLKSIVNEMMESDLKLVNKYQYLKKGGYTSSSIYE